MLWTSFRTALVAVCLVFVAAATPSRAFPGWPPFSSAAAEPGTPEWWKKHKKKATFVPHKGYQVEGFDGYYDELGRPINAPVSKVVIPQKGAGGLLNDVNFTSAVADVKQRVGLGPDETLARTAFAEGERLFREEKYGEAAKRFKETIARWPESQLAQDAMFQLAESRFFNKQYPDAVDAYDALLVKYPNSPRLDQAITRQFAIAQFWEKYAQRDPDWPVTPNMIDKKRPLFDTIGRSIKVYENIRLNDPTGPLADDAIMATANSYFVRGRFHDADYHYQLLRTEYPRSEHQYEAHVLGLQCKLRIYQGPDYDGAPLVEAQQLVKQLRMQFAGQLDADQRKRLDEIGARVAREAAARDLNMAQHYENTGYNRSAKYYHGIVVQEHAQSELGMLSKERLEALADAPDEPETPLKSLVDFFPENAERTSIAQVPLIRPTDGIEAPNFRPRDLQDAETGIATRPAPPNSSNETTYQR